MSVLLPTPGAPVTPTRQARPVSGCRAADQLAALGPEPLDHADRAADGAALAGADAGDHPVERHRASASASAAAARKRAFSSGQPDRDAQRRRGAEGAGRAHDDAARAGARR